VGITLEELARTVARTRRRALDSALERTHTALERTHVALGEALAALDDAIRVARLLSMDAPEPSESVTGEATGGDPDDRK